jgi:predicted GTPase
MFVDCKGDKFEFIKEIRKIAHETDERVKLRIKYEEKIMNIWETGGTLEDEKEAWIEYINLEISQNMLKRAKLLYERGLISLDKDRHFRISYIQFIEKHLKDP